MPNNAIYRDPLEDKSFKGAEIVDMGITGKVRIEFKEKMYINPVWLNSLRKLQETNTTWVIQKESP
jgi:hypothetical protein